MLLEITLASLPSFAKVAPTNLAELTRCSDWIVVAHLASVHEIPIAASASNREDRFGSTIDLAEAAVEQWIKGAPVADRMLFINESTWLCDGTGDFEVGDRALLFVRRQDEDEQIDRHVQDYVARFGSRPLLRILHSGRGQMPIVEVGAEERAE